MGKFTLAALVLLPLPTPSRSKVTQTTSVKCSQTRSPCTETTGTSIRNLDNSWSTVTSTNPRTGLELENASTPGSAEVPDNVKAKDGAMVMIPARKFTSESSEGHITQVK